MKRSAVFLALLFLSGIAGAQVSLKHSAAEMSHHGKSIFLRQPDGKLIYFTATGGNFYSGRLFLNGDNDDAYNGVHTTKQKLHSLVYAKTRAVAIDKWNRILIAGSACMDTNSAHMATLVRLARNGDNDAEFQPGVLQLQVGDSSEFAGIHLLADERIMAIGSCYKDAAYHFFLARLQYNGEKDAAYGTGGAFIDNSTPGNNRVVNTAAQADGKIIVAGHHYTNEQSGVVVARYYPDGTKDTMFGIGGTLITDPGALGNLQPQKMALQSDGKIVVSGVCPGEDGGRDVFVMRLTQWGTIDSSFAKTGIVRQSITFDDRLDDMVIMPDDRILLSGAGNARGEKRYTRDILLRYSPDGTRDEVYGYGPGDTKGLSATFSKKGYTALSHNIVFSEGEGKIYRLSEMISDDGIETLLMLNVYLSDTSLGVIDVPNRKTQSGTYPCAVRGRITFTYDLIDEQKVTIKLLDEGGKEVSTIVKDIEAIDGENTVTINFPPTAKPGYYSVVITTAQGYKQTIEVVKR